MESGYKTITPTELANAIWSLERGGITHHDLRVYLACAVMVAVREAAARQRAKTHKPPQPLTRYQINELERLTALPEATVRRSLKSLHRAGLLAFAESEMVFTKTPLPGSEDLLKILSCGRSPQRPVPVPRSLLRFLAKNRKSALTRTVLGYVLRGLSLSRTGEVTSKGAAKISWIADTFGLSERAVNYARRELIQLGWISADTGSFQRKLNRDGAYFVINLDWRPIPAITPKTFVNSDKDVQEFAPLPSENTPVFAPPYKDRKTSIESKNQKTQGAEAPRSGVCSIQVGEGCAQEGNLPVPNLNQLRREDFYRLSRTEMLYEQAAERGWIQPSEAMALNFVAAAVRAREVGENPARMFVALIRRQLWHHITQAQEDHARRALNRYREDDPNRFRAALRSQDPTRIAA